MLIKLRLTNIWLKYRYLFFKKWLNKVDFLQNKELLYSTPFEFLTDFNISDNVFYNDNPVWLSKDCVKLTDQGLEILCKKDSATHVVNGDVRHTDWTSGMISSDFKLTNGIWVFEAKVCDSWPAIWLLRKDHNTPGFTRHQITPEVDLMEVIEGKLKTTIHYGYSDTVYRTKMIGTSIIKPDNEFHQFAVELLLNGYNFYFDGILVSKYINNDPEFVTDSPCYVVINNAANSTHNGDNYNLVVKSMKVYSN